MTVEITEALRGIWRRNTKSKQLDPDPCLEQPLDNPRNPWPLRGPRRRKFLARRANGRTWA